MYLDDISSDTTTELVWNIYSILIINFIILCILF